MLTIHVKNFALGDALFSTYQRAATAARLIHKGGAFSPWMSTSACPRNTFIYMHLITLQRENGNELAGGLSNERAHGKLSVCCFLTPEY